MNRPPLSCLVLRATCRAALVGALCLSLGAHWFALQTVAWATMLVQYSQHTTSLAEAVAETFDGDHPCDLCKGIVKAKQSEKKPETSPTPAKPDLLCATRTITLLPRSQPFLFFESQIHSSSFIDPPPTPPPRLARA